MKRTFILFFTLVSIISIANAGLYIYIDESGREFYLYKRVCGEAYNGWDVCFVEAQNITTSMRSEIEYAEETGKRAEKDFENKIRVLYEKNKDYMWEHFPDYKYTFEEVYKEVRSLSMRTNHYDRIDNVYVCVIDAMIVSKVDKKKFYKKPYILGYIYKDNETKNKIVNSN